MFDGTWKVQSFGVVDHLSVPWQHKKQRADTNGFYVLLHWTSGAMVTNSKLVVSDIFFNLHLVMMDPTD